MEKAIALVVVFRGVADVFAPRHVDVRIVDCDNISAGDPPARLPRGHGFEALAKEAGLVTGEDVEWYKEKSRCT